MKKKIVSCFDIGEVPRSPGKWNWNWLYFLPFIFTFEQGVFTPTPAESLPNLNPAFLLSASRPFNRWPSVWFGSMLYGISMRPKYPGYWRRRALMTNDGKPSLLPLHFKLSSLDGAQAGPAWTPSTIYTQHSILRITWPKMYTVYSVICACDPKYHK